MGERALVWGLRLLGIALLVGPFIAAFAVHNWDLQAAVMPSQEEMDEVKDTLSGIVDEEFSEDILIRENLTFSDTEIRMTVTFTSPFNLTIKITEFSGYLTCDEHQGALLAQIQIKEENVEVPRQGTRTFTLVGEPTSDGIQHMSDFHGGNLPASTGFENVTATLELYGVSIQISPEA